MKYDRELWATTVSAIKRINEIQKKREDAYFIKRYVINIGVVMHRMVGRKTKETQQARKEMKQNIHLVRGPQQLQQRLLNAQKERAAAKEKNAQAVMISQKPVGGDGDDAME